MPPAVQATNLYVEEGLAEPGSLVSSLDKGLMVTDIMGLHMADPISGDFSVGATGLWIEKGETAFPVRGIAISGNLIELFKNVDGVGSDLKFYGPFGSPSLRVAKLNIAGSGRWVLHGKPKCPWGLLIGVIVPKARLRIRDHFADIGIDRSLWETLPIGIIVA
jgi:hypothetical protein